MMNISITVTRPESTSTRGTSGDAQVAIDEDGDDEGVDRRHRGRLGRREDAAVDAAQDR